MLKRKNIRLKGYDYSQEGWYFITICTKNRKQLLSRIYCNNSVGADVSVRPQLTEIGHIVQETILYIQKEYDGVKIENYVIMPNHIHIIIYLGRTGTSAPTENNSRN